MKFLAILLTYFFSVGKHDVPIAVFHIYEDSESVKIEMTCDMESLRKEMGLGSLALNLDLLSTYLAQQSTWKFDDREVTITLSSFELKGDHLSIKGHFDTEIATFKSLEITNRCFLTYKNHSNIISIDLQDITSDYRMHKERTSIRVSF